MTQLPAHLQNRQGKRQVAEHVNEGLGSAALPYVSIKGGAFTLIDSNGEQEPIATNYLDCVIIDTTAAPSRVYWGKDRAFDPNAESYPPECFSDNGIGASKNALNPQSALCQTCPQNAWGSAVSKVTGKPVKACGVIKKLAVLVYIAGGADTDGVYRGEQGFDFPFLLRVPIMSHENLRIYSNKFKTQPFDVSDVVTRINFVHGAVGVLDFNAVGYTDSETDAAIDKVLESKVTDALVGRGDQPIQGQLPAPQTAQITKEPMPAPQPAPVPFATSPQQPAPETTAKSGRGRPRKQPPPEQTSVAPFAAAPQQQAPVAPFGQQQSNHGIVQNAAAPSAEMEKTLDQIFKLPA